MLSYFFKKILRRNDEKNNLKIKSLIMADRLQASALVSSESGVGNSVDQKVVVSLTTFDKRINDVHLTIESLFQQSFKADKILLWLSRANFPNQSLPSILTRMESRGLEIHWVDEDLGSYKKIIYTLESDPQALIITVDDDVLYPVDMIDQLYQSYLAYPNAVHCHRAYHMSIVNGKPAKYSSWTAAEHADESSMLVFPTGIAGVLYPPGSLAVEVTNKEVFQSICPNADDVWLKAMSLKAGVGCKKVVDERHWKSRFLTIEQSQNYSLKKSNWKKRGGNDEKIEAVFDYYDLYSTLK